MFPQLASANAPQVDVAKLLLGPFPQGGEAVASLLSLLGYARVSYAEHLQLH
jgi:hypothetical protein